MFYLIDKSKNSVTKVINKTFSSAGFQEGKALQEWIADNPSILGEELLILQKEFSGFNNTQERLDLLVLDKNGSLVIIESKLDDSAAAGYFSWRRYRKARVHASFWRRAS